MLWRFIHHLRTLIHQWRQQPYIKKQTAISPSSQVPNSQSDKPECQHDKKLVIRTGDHVPLNTLSPKAILALESQIRASWSRYHRQDESTETDTVQARRIASLSANGRQRESAIHELAATADTGALPFMLLRLNDWVQQVRAAAEHWFDTLGDRITMQNLVECLPIFVVLRERSQGAGSKRVAALLELIAKEASANEIVNALPKEDQQTRMLVLDLLKMKGLVEDSTALGLLINHRDPILAILLLNVFHAQSLGVPEEIVNQALASPSAMLRRAVLYKLSAAQLEARKDLLRHFLTDNSRGVRQFAQFHLFRSSSKDAALAHYESILDQSGSTNRLISTAIKGFHESGGKWPAERYEFLAKHHSTRVRQTIMIAFASVRFEESLTWVQTELASPIDSSLKKTAYCLVRHHPHVVPLSSLREWALDNRRTDKERLRVLTLINCRGKWEQLPVLFQLLHASPNLFEHPVKMRLRSWLTGYNRSQTQPTKQQTQDAQRFFEKAASHFDDRIKREFNALLESVTCTH